MLTPFTTVKEQRSEGSKDPQGTRFQCLRCSCEFKPEEPSLGLESEEAGSWKPLFQNTGTSCALDPSPQSSPTLRGVWRRSPREEGLRGGQATVWHGGEIQLPACCFKQQKWSRQS